MQCVEEDIKLVKLCGDDARVDWRIGMRGDRLTHASAEKYTFKRWWWWFIVSHYLIPVYVPKDASELHHAPPLRQSAHRLRKECVEFFLNGNCWVFNCVIFGYCALNYAFCYAFVQEKVFSFGFGMERWLLSECFSSRNTVFLHRGCPMSRGREGKNR